MPGGQSLPTDVGQNECVLPPSQKRPSPAVIVKKWMGEVERRAMTVKGGWEAAFSGAGAGAVAASSGRRREDKMSFITARGRWCIAQIGEEDADGGKKSGRRDALHM